MGYHATAGTLIHADLAQSQRCYANELNIKYLIE